MCMQLGIVTFLVESIAQTEPTKDSEKMSVCLVPNKVFYIIGRQGICSSRPVE